MESSDLKKDKNSSSRTKKQKINEEISKLSIPILNSENYHEWHRKMIEYFKTNKLYYWIEDDVKLKDMRPNLKAAYKTACKKVTRLLLATTEKEDQELIRSKTNENIATAWIELLKKYDETKIERMIKVMEKLFALKSNPNETGEEFITKIMNYSKMLIKSVDSIDDFAFLLVMSKLNNEFPKKYKEIEDYLKNNIDRITIDDLEKKICELQRIEDEKKRRESIDGLPESEIKSIISKSSDIDLKTEQQEIDDQCLSKKKFIEKTIEPPHLLVDLGKIKKEKDDNLVKDEKFIDYKTLPIETKINESNEIQCELPRLIETKLIKKETGSDESSKDQQIVIDSLKKHESIKSTDSEKEGQKNFELIKLELEKKISKSEQKKTSRSVNFFPTPTDSSSDSNGKTLTEKDQTKKEPNQISTKATFSTDLSESNSLQISSSEQSSEMIKNLEDRLNINFKNVDIKSNTKSELNQLSEESLDSKDSRNFDKKHPNLNIGVKQAEIDNYILGYGITPPSSPTQSLTSTISSNKIIQQINFKTINNRNDVNDKELNIRREEDSDNPFLTIRNLPKFISNNLILQESDTNIKTNELRLKDDNLENFFLNRLPVHILKRIFFLLREKDIISFINAHRICYNFMNDLLKETIIVTQDYSSPFFQNLFYTNEFVNHKNILRISKIFNLQHRDYTDITKQIRKMITNEFENLQLFPLIEHLEIIEPTKDTINKNLRKSNFYIKLNHLEILSLIISPFDKNYIMGNIIVRAPKLSAIKLVNITDVRLSNPERIVYFDLDVYHKIVEKFTNLVILNCRNFINFKRGLIRKGCRLKEIHLVNVYKRNLINLFQKRKFFKLNHLKIYVQGIRLNGLNQTIILRDLTTFCGEMRIYMKYLKRLDSLDFLASLVVNFDVRILNKKLLNKMTNLENLEINFPITDRLRWSQLLKTSKILKTITIYVPLEQIYLNLISESCPNCLHLYLLNQDDDIDYQFINGFRCLTYIQVNKEMNLPQINLILQFNLKYLSVIKFLYQFNLLAINFNRTTNIVEMTYKNRSLFINNKEFHLQIRVTNDWSEFTKRMSLYNST